MRGKGSMLAGSGSLWCHKEPVVSYSRYFGKFGCISGSFKNHEVLNSSILEPERNTWFSKETLQECLKNKFKKELEASSVEKVVEGSDVTMNRRVRCQERFT
jgi:hypothetical protein